MMMSRDISVMILWRLAGMVVLVLLISFGVFSLLHVAPGSTEQMLIGTRPTTPERIQTIRAQYNLDEPFVIQYWLWLVDAMRLDFGTSARTIEPVISLIRERAGLSLFLGLYAFIIAMVVGVPLGIVSAIKKRTMIDRSVTGVSVIGVSTPAFVSGIFLLYVFAVLLNWFPVFGQGQSFVDQIWHLTLPALALALSGMALVLKFTRAGMIVALDEDYVVFARARGISARRVVIAHALRNALVPIVTAGGLLLTVMLTGAVLVEVVFALPVLGSLLVESIDYRDIPVLQGLAMILATIVILVNLLTDLLYLFVDPRIRVKG